MKCRTVVCEVDGCDIVKCSKMGQQDVISLFVCLFVCLFFCEVDGCDMVKCSKMGQLDVIRLFVCLFVCLFVRWMVVMW